MPLLLWPIAIGGGVWLGGSGVNEAATGTMKAAVGVAVVGAAYLILKKKGVF